MIDSGLTWTPHPVHPIVEIVGYTGDGRFDCVVGTRRQPMTPAQVAEYWSIRENGIRLERDEPLFHGFEPQHWKDADALLEEYNILCIFGGNQASKTEYLLKRSMQELATKENWNTLLLQNNELSSKQLHQKTCWKYMPKEWKTGKRRRGSEGNISYDPKTGFADNIFTTDLGGTCIFGNYGQDLSKYEGLQFNKIGPDENMPLLWFEALKRGLSTRGGNMVWAFTPINGMTPAIASQVNGARTVKSLPVDTRLKGMEDPTERHVKDCPPGHMPYIAVRDEVAIIYFHSILNKFGDYENLRGFYGNKSKSETERRFFGFARKLQRVSFPKFGDAHIKPHAALMARIAEQPVTRYHFMDPAGARNSFMIWVAVDGDGRHYIYREWPDVPRYGEWAVASENPRLWDGEPGPAQTGEGLSVRSYKRIILTEEGWNFDRASGWIKKLAAAAGKAAREIAEKCEKLMPADRAREIAAQTEDIFMRYVDPRAGRNQTIGDRDDGSSIIARFEEEQVAKDGSGVIDGPAMDFTAAPGFQEGKGIDGDDSEGKQGINDLLDYDESEKITRGINEPMLLISNECQNLIWAFQNYTGNDGQKAACKDPIDCARYMATADLQHVDNRHMVAFEGGGY